MKKFTLTAVLLVAFSSVAFADEASLGGVGGAPEIVPNDVVQMREETIKIDIYPSLEDPGKFTDWDDMEWQKGRAGYTEFEIVYTFVNEGEVAEKLQIGFPEQCDYLCGGEDDNYVRDELLDFEAEILVDGKWKALDVSKKMNKVRIEPGMFQK